MVADPPAASAAPGSAPVVRTCRLQTTVGVGLGLATTDNVETVGCDGAGCHHSIGLVGRSSWNRCPFSSLLTSHPSALSLAPSRNVLSRTRLSRRDIGERDGVEQARLHERAVEEGEGGFQSTHQRPPPAPHCERATVWDTRHSASVPSAPTYRLSVASATTSAGKQAKAAVCGRLRTSRFRG